MIRTGVVLSCLGGVCLVHPGRPTVLAQAPVRVLLITGQSNRFHNWPVSSAIIKRQLEESRWFVVTVATTPPKGTEPNQDMSSFAPDFRGYGAVVLDYEGFEFAPPTKRALGKGARGLKGDGGPDRQ